MAWKASACSREQGSKKLSTRDSPPAPAAHSPESRWALAAPRKLQVAQRAAMRSCPRPPPPARALALALTLAALLADPASAASFFGENHLEVPMAMALTDIDLQLQFSTAQPEALLLLAAGPADHLLLQLHSGHLQVRLVLGQEVMRLQTPKETLLSDSTPHTVALTVTNSWAMLSVDSRLNASGPAPPAPLEVPYGLFIGGTGSLRLPYLRGASRPLRGCLHGATLNGRSLLRPLTPDVPEGCAEEFSAGDDVALGFSGPHSLTTFPAWGTRDEGSLEFTLTTRSRQAPLAFQAGGRHGDFIYVDVFEGHLRAMVEKGQGTVLLHNSVPVADGLPHEISIHIDTHRLEISVDQYPTRTSNRGVPSYLEPRGSLLLGGLDAEASRHLWEHRLGLAPGAANASLLGCMEDLSVNGQRHGLRDALLTRHMVAGCRPEEEEYEEEVYSPYEAFSTLAPEAWPTLELPEPCTPEAGLPPVFANFTRLLTISPLVVAEGGAAWLEWRHVQPTLDLSEAELRKSQVLFSVIRGARHGELELDIPGAQARKMFTLLDVVNRKARFVHDGAEEPADQLVLEVSVTARGLVPSCLRRGQTYILPVQVNPINDPPRLVFPHGSLMVILEHTQKPLGPEVFQAYDPDSACEGLTFQLLGSPSGLPVERRDQPGQPATEFSCRELEAGSLVYVHRGGPAQDLTFRVSDGLQASPAATLKVVAVQPAIRLLHNTGLRLAQGSAAPILPANLSVETNAVGQEISVLFRLTGGLRFGELQKQGAGGMEGAEWRATQAFHQRDVEQGRVRYLSTDPSRRAEDTVEYLTLEVQVGREMLSNLSFPVRVQRADIWLLQLEPLHTQNSRQEALTTAHLEATVEGTGPSPASFHYKVVQAPTKGNLRLQGTRLSAGQSFTQDDLQAGRVTYGATARASEAVEDAFHFRVTAPPHFSPLYTFPIHIGGDPSAPVLTNVLLSVPEGGQAVISADHLFVKTLNSAGYLYEVMERPRHGRLAWRDTQDQDTTVMSFTNEDLLHGRLVYQHDDSETTEDDIPFVATRQGEGSGGTAWEEVRGVFRVAIQPVNDHAPVQTVSHVFHVARGGQRLLTTDDVAFSDPDSGSADAQLVLTRKDLLFGSIVAVDEPSRPIYRFTQEDLRERRVLFVHSGADRGWIQLQVSDGQHQATALLEVQASEPYLRLANGSSLVVPQGGQGTIDTAVLHLDTNLDVRTGDEVRYQVTSGPRWGQLLQAGQPTSAFSQRDLLDGTVIYHHNGSLSPRDTLALSVEAGSVRTDANLQVTIALEGPLPLLHLAQHKKIYVFQGEAAEIRRDQLQIWEGATAPIPPEALRGTDRDSEPEDLVYHIEPPQNGRVVLREAPDTEVRSFTQAQLDSALVLFTHTGTLDGGFHFSLSDGEHISPGHFFRVVAHKPLLLSLEGSRTLTICPGSTQPLSSHIMRASSSEGTDPRHLLYRVVRGPRLGRLLHTQQASMGEALVNFTQAEVSAGHVLYEHEMPAEPFWEVRDTLELLLSSPPAPDMTALADWTLTAYILLPGLWVPEGQRAEITVTHLDASNLLASVPPPQRHVHDVLFRVTQFPTRGQLLVSGEPLHAGEPHFLQSQLSQGQLAYAHGGGGSQQDSFRFRAHLQGPAGASVAGPQTSEAFVIMVHDVNERPPQPQASAPLRLTRGSRAPVSRAQLSVVDPDSAPGEIEYKVLRTPHNGFLSLEGGGSGPVTRFTQADVDAGRLALVANGSSVAGIFQLSVSDGASPPLAMSLAMDILPSNVEVQLRAPLEVPQATGRALLSRQQLRVVSDREEPDAAYRLTQGPQYGHLLVGGQPASAFSQVQVDQGQVVFAFTNLSSAQDCFSILALARGANASATVNVTVRALLHVWAGGPWPQGATLRLDPAILDASELAKLTGSVPRFRLLAGPQHGRVVRLPRARTEPRSGQLVEQFTQQDLEAGRLGLVVGRPPGPAGDSLTLEVWAQGVPPAVASLDFTTEPYNAARSYGVALLSLPEAARTEAEMPESSSPTLATDLAAASPIPTVSRGGLLGFLEANMFSVIIPVCLVLLLLALILPLLFYLRKRNKTGKHDVQVLAAKPRNGLAGDTETFRKVEPGQAIPLTAVPGQGPPPGSQPDPELLQFCRTPNPALKNGQYWV
ncbi:chondroitin sulfate proteoglycan 4 [Echinops telfairi]|uniref:Chondroitin sulfate proteoglycan 4 n=1 Tax=Echinops telfairi TaxID=9371 RepID=A0AC55CNZ8_ECHTE|nr:chondroitin sulfate proteoglycan 4 [Echinops telfairi]